MSHKLTEAQKNTIVEISNKEKWSCVETYPPMLKLRALGLITTKPIRYSRAEVTLTEAGQEWLNNNISKKNIGQ